MSNEKFTQGEWFLGNPFRHKDSRSEWRNVYADKERNPVALVLIKDWAREKEYHNATLIAAAPEMYEALVDLVGNCRPEWQEVNVSKETINKALKALKKARGEE